MLWVDEGRFRVAVVALADAAVHCREVAGLFVNPPTADPKAVQAQVLAALTALMQAPVVIENTAFVAPLSSEGEVRTAIWPPQRERT